MFTLQRLPCSKSGLPAAFTLQYKEAYPAAFTLQYRGLPGSVYPVALTLHKMIYPAVLTLQLRNFTKSPLQVTFAGVVLQAGSSL